MSLQYPDEDSQMSFSDDEEVISPEDLELNVTFHVTSPQEEIAPNNPATEAEENKSHASEEDSDEDGNLDPEFRAVFKELCEIHEYAEEDRGVISSASVTGSPCTSALLEAIVQNIRVLKRVLVLEPLEETEDPTEWLAVEEFASATILELSRLGEHPELFPSKDIRKRFWKDVHRLSNHALESIIPLQKAQRKDFANLRAVTVGDELELLPKRDMKRTPWEQYLHNRAPGIEVDLSTEGEGGSVQIFPMAAARIAMAMFEENRVIIADIESRRPDGTPYQENPMAGLYAKRERLSPDGNLRSHKMSRQILRPILAGSMEAPRDPASDSLELMNQDFNSLSGQRDPFAQQLWNCTGVIIRERPNPDVDTQHAAT